MPAKTAEEVLSSLVEKGAHLHHATAIDELNLIVANAQSEEQAIDRVIKLAWRCSEETVALNLMMAFLKESIVNNPDLDLHERKAAERQLQDVSKTFDYLDWLPERSSAQEGRRHSPAPRSLVLRPAADGRTTSPSPNQRELSPALSPLLQRRRVVTAIILGCRQLISRIVARTPTLAQVFHKFKNANKNNREISPDSARDLISSIQKYGLLGELFRGPSKESKSFLFPILNATLLLLKEQSCSTKAAAAFVGEIAEEYGEYLKEKQKQRHKALRFFDKVNLFSTYEYHHAILVTEKVGGCVRDFSLGDPGRPLELKFSSDDKEQWRRHESGVQSATLDDPNLCLIVNTLEKIRLRSIEECGFMTPEEQLLAKSKTFKEEHGETPDPQAAKIFLRDLQINERFSALFRMDENSEKFQECLSIIICAMNAIPNDEQCARQAYLLLAYYRKQIIKEMQLRDLNPFSRFFAMAIDDPLLYRKLGLSESCERLSEFIEACKAGKSVPLDLQLFKVANNSTRIAAGNSVENALKTGALGRINRELLMVLRDRSITAAEAARAARVVEQQQTPSQPTAPMRLAAR